MGSHSERAHAILSPSSSKRWVSCPPSALLNDALPDESSEAALEGTLAHEIAEVLLEMKLFVKDIDECTARIKTLKKSKYYSKAMLEYCHDYANHCVLLYDSIKKTSRVKPRFFIEVKLDLSRFAAESFGSLDFGVVGQELDSQGNTVGVVYVVDLKFGMLDVEVRDNYQLKLYGLGLFNAYGHAVGARRVVTQVYQPRTGNLGKASYNIGALISWGETVKKVSNQAIAGKGTLSAGEHCLFCRYDVYCPEKLNIFIQFVAMSKKNKLVDEDYVFIVRHKKALTKWLDSVDSRLKSQILNGDKVDGLKLVEGQRRRTIEDYDSFVSELVTQGYTEDELYRSEQLPLGELEKTIGVRKLQKYEGTYVTTKACAPQVVLASDARPSVASLGFSDWSDWSDEDTQAPEAIDWDSLPDEGTQAPEAIDWDSLPDGDQW